VLIDVPDEVMALRAVDLEGNVFHTSVLFLLAPAR
jgi:hypothetical protein